MTKTKDDRLLPMAKITNIFHGENGQQLGRFHNEADQDEPSGSRYCGGRSTSRTTSLATSSTGGRHGQQGALGIATPRRRGKEAPPQDIVSDPNYLAPFVPLLTMPPMHEKSLSGPVHK
ncbi:hypothetical protein PVAP13_5KG548000 [Panicum virgatum]|uniref:Uncharacterized protein n=1 Tax=Panicum virgatum TaxID=38727 RepID=A0A8T0SRB6_PANVG|nr:hypothetical protein PVAP13_5KG548000 [Panicum virgatum]